MTDSKINISLKSIPYKKRRTSIFWWTFLLYVFIAIVIGLSSELGAFLFIMFFLTILFAIDLSRRLKWVRYSLISLDTNEKGLLLSFYDYDELNSVTISWDKLKISRGSTFTNNSKRTITFKDGETEIATFFANSEFDNTKIDELHKKLKGLNAAIA